MKSYIFWTHSIIGARPEIFQREILAMLLCPLCLSIRSGVLERPSFPKRAPSLPHTRQPVKEHSSVLLLILNIAAFQALSGNRTLDTLQPSYYRKFSMRESYVMEDCLKPRKTTPSGGIGDSKRNCGRHFALDKIFICFQIFQRLLVMLRSCENI